MRLLDAGQLLLQAVHLDEELLVVQAEQVQDGRVPVGDADAVLDGRQAEFVGRAVGRARL